MSYRTLIKSKFPVLSKVLINSPLLMRLAIKCEAMLLTRERKREIKKYQANGNHLRLSAITLLPTAKHHGLFDLSWYNSVQQQKFTDELSAFSDYLHKSRFSGVSPSPAFDNLSYLKSHMDVYHAGVSPLEHYIQTGHQEHRITQPFVPKWQCRDNLETRISAPTENQQKVALCFHIFYEDFIDYYASALENFPITVDLLLTVSDIKYEKDINEKLAVLPAVNSVTVKAVPNRGRNFGPMLVEYAQRLQEYDLFCHMHSKKSLYSGRAQTQWADYLGEFLLKDHNVISKMLNYMHDNEDTGIYYPTTFPITPDWANHWLKNKPYKAKFFEEWQIEDDSDFLSYPVGGMFWAKPKALKQLLDKQYQYEDFPAEPLPNDGSELHALERMIGLLAEKNGYKQLFYYPDVGTFTHDKSYIFTNYQCNQKALLDKLNPFDIISFDIFDTLVRRSHFAPDYAKWLLGKRLSAEGLVETPEDFVAKRNRAELQVRKQKDFKGDVNIIETYHQLATELSWSDAEAKHYAEIEFSYDLEMIQSKDEMVSILNTLLAKGKEIYVISDTYYTEEQIIKMLSKANVPNGYKLFVSSELGMRKDNGTMWSHIKETLPEGKSFVHIGDNAVADAQIPGDFGLQNLHILNPLDKWQAAGWDNPLQGNNKLNEQQIKKWGPLISDFGRYPFLDE